MNSKHTPPKPRYSSIRGVDPYIDWVLGAGRPRYFRDEVQQDWVSVLLWLRGMSVHDFARGVLIRDTRRADWRASIRIPKFYIKRDVGVGADADTHFTAIVREQFFKFLLEKRNVRLREVVRQVTLSLP